MPEYSVPEDEGPVEVCVLIPAGQLERSVVVNLQTVAQTATGKSGDGYYVFSAKSSSILGVTLEALLYNHTSVSQPV